MRDAIMLVAMKIARNLKHVSTCKANLASGGASLSDGKPARTMGGVTVVHGTSLLGVGFSIQWHFVPCNKPRFVAVARKYHGPFNHDSPV